MSAILQDVEIDLILPKFKARSQKQVLQDLVKPLASKAFCAPEKLFELLIQKQIHGGSAIGDGIALPELQIDHLQRPMAALAVLDKPIAFNAPDNRAVDMVCLLLSPAQEGPLHLRRLARLTRMFKNPDLCNKIREAKDAEVIRALLIAPEGWMLAA